MIRRLFLVVLTFVHVSCASEGPYREFDAEIESFLDEHDLTGATAVIVHRDLGIMHVQGYGDLDPDRISLLASSSKVVSVGVIMRLVDQGLLDLDAPISTYLSASYGDYKTDITLAQLLSNSAGMVGLIDDPTYNKYVCQYLAADTMASCTKLIYQADDVADRVPPDTAWRYGGGQWQLAGGIASAVSGKTWDELVAETYAPCDLSVLGYNNHYAQALFEGDGTVEGALKYPEFFRGDPAYLKPTQNPNVEGGGYSDVRSYGEILLMHLRHGMCDAGRVLSEASVARMQVDRIGPAYGGSTVDPSMPGYGLGWWVSREQPGLVADAGAFGALPFLDEERGYAVMVILEAYPDANAGLRDRLRPIVERLVDGMTAP